MNIFDDEDENINLLFDDIPDYFYSFSPAPYQPNKEVIKAQFEKQSKKQIVSQLKKYFDKHERRNLRIKYSLLLNLIESENKIIQYKHWFSTKPKCKDKQNIARWMSHECDKMEYLLYYAQ